MKATLTLDFGDRLRPEESRDVIDEARRRGVPLEDVITEALREWRAARVGRAAPSVAGALPSAALPA